MDSDKPDKPIEQLVDDYGKELKKEYRRKEDVHLIEKKQDQLRSQLIERFEHDEERSLEDIRAEEHFNISTNMWLSVISTLVFTVWALNRGDDILAIAKATKTFITANLSWFFVLLATGAIIFLLGLAFSRFGDVVLGEPTDQPEFSDISWYSMLFSAGMGVGLLFWGGAEPVIHYLNPPVGEGGTIEAARQALALTMFHWGLHGWGVYTLCAVAVAYYGFRKRKKYLISTSVIDLFKNPKINQVLKISADLAATVAIIFGVAASLGMGTLQMATGLQTVYDVPADNPTGRVAVLALVTVAFILSATTGLKKGIKILSNFNMGLSVLLLLFIFLVGPKLFILKVFVESVGLYLVNLPSLSFRVAPFTPAYESWMESWTLTYFTWWIAWSPFVGIFIARVSRGRTIKELILGALMVPTMFTILWFSVFGGAALSLEMYSDGGGIGSMVAGPDGDPVKGLFSLLGMFPASGLVGTVTLILLFTFLVTSADSATFVIAMMTTEGDLDPSLKTKIVWGVLLAGVTAALVQGGTLDPIQAAALTSAFPFSIILILMAVVVPLRLSSQVKKRRL